MLSFQTIQIKSRVGLIICGDLCSVTYARWGHLTTLSRYDMVGCALYATIHRGHKLYLEEVNTTFMIPDLFCTDVMSMFTYTSLLN